jgi:peptidyl-prolyl cis-trans isomerase C
MRYLKDPLVVFLLFGLALFLIQRSLDDGVRSENYRIEITEGLQNRILDQWQAQMGRAPTPTEARGLLDQWIREEILYREARSLGLDENDTIIRRRLAQKLTFLNEDLANAVEPTAEELERYFDQHAADYRIPERFSFEHRYFSSDRREDARADAGTAMESGELTGDPFILQKSYADRSAREIGDLFGAGFAESLAELDTSDPDGWQGPIESAYGWHLVRVIGHAPARDPLMAEVADAVRRDFLQARRRDANETFYRELRSRYDIQFAESKRPLAGDGGTESGE